MGTDMRGPMFIVGLPRSGTKLVRDLLNNSPQISIPNVESLYIPAVLKKFSQKTGGLNKSDLRGLYAFIRSTAFFESMQVEGVHLSFDLFQQLNPEGIDLSEVLSNVMQFYSLQLKPGAVVYGDKSPYYRLFLPEIKQIFPSAVFIHVIRDPRDVALSTRRAWRRSIYRAVHDWNEQVYKTCIDSEGFKQDYHEIFYEELLEEPEVELKKLFDFLKLKFEPEFTLLKHATEDLGDARGKTSILETNTLKYRVAFTPNTIKRLNQIAYPSAVALGYLDEGEAELKPLPDLLLRVLRAHDAIKSLIFHMLDKGFLKGIEYTWKLKRIRV